MRKCDWKEAKQKPRLEQFPDADQKRSVYSVQTDPKLTSSGASDRRRPPGGDAFGGSLGLSYSPEDMDPGADFARTNDRIPSGDGPGGAARTGPRQWSVVGLSVLGSAVCMAAAGCVCALIYPILKGKGVCVHVYHVGVCVSRTQSCGNYCV